MVMILSIKSNINVVTRDLDRLERQQIPFAQATAVNSLAALVQNAEKQEMRTTFDGVTPFTLGGVKVSRARKSDPTATVFLGAIAEQYLAPFISGGRHFLGTKRGLLNPKNLTLNRYGNIPVGRLAALKGESDVFVGSIKTKRGATISGVWQRPAKDPKQKRRKGAPVTPNRSGHLKLLIRFTDPQDVRQRLKWFETAADGLSRNADREMDLAMKMALATAKP